MHDDMKQQEEAMAYQKPLADEGQHENDKKRDDQANVMCRPTEITLYIITKQHLLTFPATIDDASLVERFEEERNDIRTMRDMTGPHIILLYLSCIRGWE